MKKRSQQGFTIVEIIIVVVVLVALGLTGWLVHKKHSDKASSSSKDANSTVVNSQSTSAVRAGTDNRSLQNDLTGITNSQNTAAQDGNQLNNALNDQQNEISVPTN